MRRSTSTGRFTSALAVALVAMVMGSARGSDKQTAHAGALSNSQREQIDALFKEYEVGARPGCALAVGRNGAAVYARGYGFADLEHNVRITPATLFDIGSVSKQFTAAAVILLELDGKLALADDVRKYIPELPSYGSTITIDHLMHHTSGLRDYNALLSLAGIDEKDLSNDAQALALIARQRGLNFPTGSRYEYSNTGYFLLSVIVQRVSGRSLAQFARERLFLPLGMSHAQFRDRHDTIIPGRALGYAAAQSEEDADPPGKDPPHFVNALSNWEQTGDGSLHLSVEEALKWNDNFHDPRIGGRALVERLQQTGALTNGEPISYARGLSVDRYRGVKRVQHGGNWVGYNAMLARFPEQRTSIAVFCNFEGAEAAALSNKVADVLLADVLQPASPTAAGRNVAAAPSSHGRFVGSYFADQTQTVFEVSESAQVLTLKIGSMSLPLAPVGPASFAVGNYPVSVEFGVEEGGTTQQLQLQVDDDPPTLARRFVPVVPDVRESSGYVGSFYSSELDATWSVVIDQGRPALRREKRKFVVTTEPLEPAMRDAFSSEAGFIRFVRDSSARVTGFDLSSSRMRGMHFQERDSN